MNLTEFNFENLVIGFDEYSISDEGRITKAEKITDSSFRFATVRMIKLTIKQD